MDTQEVFVTFLLVLVALFLQELARRATQRVSSPTQTGRPVTYFDFVRLVIVYPRFQKPDSLVQAFSICAYTLMQLIYLPWLAVVWWYTASLPRIPILEPALLNFAYFVLNFWIMFFIAVSVFLPYWLFGWLSFWKYKLFFNAHSIPYSGRFSLEDVKHHIRHYGIRLLSWCLLLLVTFVIYCLALLIPH